MPRTPLNLDLAHLVQQVIYIAKDAGAFIRENVDVPKDSIETKDFNSLVSYVDQLAEKRIVSALHRLLPEAGFLTEEDTQDDIEGKDFFWIIDPLDGTTNFLHHLPFYAVSIALYDKNLRGLLGVVLEINREEVFHAYLNGGAYRNGLPIHVAEDGLEKAILATGFPYSDFSEEEAYFKLFRKLSHECRGIRRLGAAALDLAYVADGRFGGFFEYNLHTWDIAAGVVLVREAGGIVTDLGAGDGWYEGSSILAASPLVHQHVLRLQ